MASRPSTGTDDSAGSSAAASSASCTARDTGTASCMDTLPVFLKKSFNDFSSIEGKRIDRPVHITIGNEAGDADSIVSALVHGHVLSLEESVEQRQRGRSLNTLYAPVVGVPRSDLPLRRETTLLLEMAGVDLDSVLCVDDPPSIASLLQECADDGPSSTGSVTKISLLDHNRIRSSLQHLEGGIVEILDHHEDELAHSHVEGDNRNVAFEGRDALVGSTCTLVAERLFRAVASLDDATVDPSASLALLGVILLDTMDMSVEAGKGTIRDKSAIETILKHTDWSKINTSAMSESERGVFVQSDEGRPSRSALHDLLRNSKFDKEFWNDLSAWDCLRIDYKRFEPPRASNLTPAPIPFGMSSVLLPLSDFLSKDDCIESIVKYLLPTEGGAGVPLLGILTMTLVDDRPYREMLLAGRPDLVDATANFFVESDDAAFLEAVEADLDVMETVPEGLHVRRFRQGNAKGSRKQVAPVLLRLASGLEL